MKFLPYTDNCRSAVFTITANGRGYEIVAEYEARTIEPHKATYEPRPFKFALQPLYFIAFISNCILLIFS